ncbi:helix-turn-helix domain-containing protein [Rhodopseudomonas boonkerdii]|uniref:AraC family transcriptional regulator n=1 Tax=Rhodopseudomonas boonkerdii TaxID=475937 RepID=UPI001E450F83|nr:AraC family transcriptional regulator [Rhodopseudomonas boonkerdii]UGV24776.1 helix-turn-helix domain-containing protein [Rhodopseudomonas boonkerdii]
MDTRDLIEKSVALHVERFTSGLSPRIWSIRQPDLRRSHLLILESRSGTATLQGTVIAFQSPALLWLPCDYDGSLHIEAGAQGYLVAITDDLLTQTIAGSAEALHLRRTIDRLVLLEGAKTSEGFAAIAASCNMLAGELATPGRGSATMLSAHVLLMCLHLWRSLIAEEPVDDVALRGDGPRLVGNFMQMVELHYRDGWPIARYAAALGVTDDKLHAHCKRETGVSPRAIVHQRLIREACTRLRQLDLPVEQIAYGLGFHDPGYFNRFFRKHQNESPGTYRRRARLSPGRHGPSYAAWP